MVVEQPKFAMALGILFVVTPLTDWLAQVVVDLVTLRRGARIGLRVFAVVCMASVIHAYFSTSVESAMLNTGLTYIPGYLAAMLLRSKSQWRAPSAILLGMTMVFAVLVHIFIPEFIIAQYNYLKSVLGVLPNLQVFDFIRNEPEVAANYVFGFQLMGIILSSVFSLIVARRIQSDLYYPEGFKREMLNFRAEKWVFLVFVIAFFAARQNHFISINFLPILGLYFVLSGLSLACYFVYARVKSYQKIAIIILLLAVCIVPWLLVPVYVCLGMMDCLINFRGYLSVRSSGTI